jgi:2-phosphosulfolactate phosphatase
MTPEAVAGRTIVMTTTNGTRAILAARGAEEVLVGSLANRSATARHLLKGGRDVTCVCAGTDGERAPEDELSAEAFRSALISGPPFQEMAFQPLRKAMLETAGGRNLVAAGMGEDVDFAAHADRLNVVCKLTRQLNNIVRRVA